MMLVVTCNVFKSDSFQRIFGWRQTLFDSESPARSHQRLISVIMVFVVLTCSVFTVLMLNAAVSRSIDEAGQMKPANGKHAAIEFAVNKKYQVRHGAFACLRPLTQMRPLRRLLVATSRMFRPIICFGLSQILAEQGKVIPQTDLMDESGNLMGGKRAALQFARKRRNIKRKEFTAPEKDDSKEEPAVNSTDLESNNTTDQ